jgi:ParB family chromosome partitioning protein
MKKAVQQTVHKILGSNNLLLIVADGYNTAPTGQEGNAIADLALDLAARLNSYAVVNTKYKRELMDLADIRTLQNRPRVRDAFLLPIQQFKEEIVRNSLLPLVILLQPLSQDFSGDAMIYVGYGQGERASATMPHHPTISTSLLSKIRIAIEDQHLQTAMAPIQSLYCGREGHHLNQIFRNKQYPEFFAPEVRSLLLSFRYDLINQQQTALSIAQMLAPALAQFCEAMSVVRYVDIDTIDTDSSEDLQYIFRLQSDSRYSDLLRESYIAELASSIHRNGLLHPLVLLKKNDGRYKILCGFRRFQALKRLDRPVVEAKVYQEGDFSPEDFFNISLAENTKRRNLNPIEIGNFLDTASKTLGLSNAELAEQFGATLGIGKPGQQVSHSTIHKYRKVNQIRMRGESPEMISDVINEKLQFSVAAEMLAPIKNSTDRDTLYLQIVKPLAPTRPQLVKLMALLHDMAPSLHEAITSKGVQQALAKASSSSQPMDTLLKILTRKVGSNQATRRTFFDDRLQTVRRMYFGEKASKRDFNISPAGTTEHDEFIVQFRLKRNDITRTLEQVTQALTQEDLLSIFLEKPVEP